MDDRSTFDDAEWEQICRLPVMTASLISAVDYSAMSERQEFQAFSDFVQNAGRKYRKSSLISAVLDDIKAGHLSRFQEHCESVATALSGDKPIENALRSAKQVSIIVEKRLPKKTSKLYKNFIMDVAMAVARAHKESLLPFGNAVSPIEDYHIRRLGEALGY